MPKCLKPSFSFRGESCSCTKAHRSLRKWSSELIKHLLNEFAGSVACFRSLNTTLNISGKLWSFLESKDVFEGCEITGCLANECSQ